MPLQRLDPTISRPSTDIAGAVQPSARSTSSGLSSVSSQLQGSVRESAHGFLDSFSISDCANSFFKRCLAFFKSLFPCFFSAEEAPIQTEPEPLPFTCLHQRITTIKNRVKELLHVRDLTPSQTGAIKPGISPDILNGGKVAILLKYNTHLTFCSKHLQQGVLSLAELISETNRTIEEIVNHPDNSRAQTAIFVITIIAMNKFTTVVNNGKRIVVMSNRQRQTDRVSFDLNFRSSRHILKYEESRQCKREEFIQEIKSYTNHQEIKPARRSLIEQGLERFFYN